MPGLFVRVYDGGWGITRDVTGVGVWNGIDTGTPLYIDTTNTYHIAFLDEQKRIQYLYSNDLGATWVANHPESGLAIGDDPAPGPGPDGKVRIYAHGPESTPSLTYWEGDGSDQPWGDRILYVPAPVLGAGYDCSVNVRWSRYFWHYPEWLDIAYWKSDYPTNTLYVGSEFAPVHPWTT